MNQTPAPPPPQPAPATQQRFLAEFPDAFDRRTFLLVIAVLLIQAGFVLSYAGPFTTQARTGCRSLCSPPRRSRATSSANSTRSAASRYTPPTPPIRAPAGHSGGTGPPAGC